jgi:hypothetical protein
MTRVQEAALQLAYFVIFAIVLIEWFCGCGSPEGECVVLHHAFPFIISALGV